MLRSLWGSCLAFAFVCSARAEPPQKPQQEKAAGGNLERLWNDLADADAARAYRAIWALVRTPEQTTAYIAEQLPPAVAPDPTTVEKWIADLNSARFAVREKANQELTKLSELAEPALRRAVKANWPLEPRQRVEKLLARLLGPIPFPDHLRAVRALETLEYLGTGEAEALLKKYAAGAPGARLTQEAGETLARLGKAEPSAPPPKQSRLDLYGDPLPAGAVARLGTIRFRRDSHRMAGLLGLAFFPDGKTLLTGGEGQDVQLWETATGRLLRALPTKPLFVLGVAVGPDGKRLAVAGAHPLAGTGEIRLYDLPSGKPLRIFSRPNQEIDRHCDLAFSPDGKLLFSLGSPGGILRIEDIPSGKELLQKEIPGEALATMAVSGDGTCVAVASGPNTGKNFLWKWRNEEPRPLQGTRFWGCWLSFSPDGKLLAAVGDVEGGLRVWEVPGGRLLYSQQAAEEGYSFFGKPTFTPDGKSLALILRHGHGSGKGRIQLLDPWSGRSQGMLAGTSMGSRLAVSADSRSLALAAGTGVRIWDLASRKELGANGEGHQDAPWHIIGSPKGFLVTAGDDGAVRIWDAATGRQLRQFPVENPVRAIVLSPDGELLAAAGLNDDAMHVWDTRTGREVHRLEGHGRGDRRALGFHPDGRSLLSLGNDYTLRLWDMKTGKARFERPIRSEGIDILHEDERADATGWGVGSTTLAADGKSLVLQIGSNFHLFDTSTGMEKRKFPSEGKGCTVAISANGKYLLAAAYGQHGQRMVSLAELSSGTTVQRLLLPGYRPGPVAFAGDGRVFAVAVEGPPDAVHLYEVASGKVRATIRGLRGSVRSLAFLQDGRRLASGMSNSTVLIWDLTSPEDLNRRP